MVVDQSSPLALAPTAMHKDLFHAARPARQFAHEHGINIAWHDQERCRWSWKRYSSDQLAGHKLKLAPFKCPPTPVPIGLLQQQVRIMAADESMVVIFHGWANKKIQINVLHGEW